MAELLFVYGTLKRGQPHHALLSDCRYRGAGAIAGALYALPEGVPAASPVGEGAVHGELYELPDYGAFILGELDAYEGVEHGLFVRARARVDDREAWVYWAGPALRATLAALRPLAAGRWPEGKRA